MSTARAGRKAPLCGAGERSLLGLLLAAVLAFYAWTVLSTAEYVWKIDGTRQGDYYNLLADGFLDGHLYLKVDVPEALVHAENPYDPAKRPPGSALHDASYYRGRYYLYFGVTPVVTLYLPFTLLLGSDLPQHYGNFVFAGIGFCCATGLFLMLRRRYFPGAGFGVVVVGVLALGLGSMIHAVVRRPSFWELPIASAYAFAMLTLVCIYRALHGRRQATWMLLAGLSFGLAVGSRPTYAVAGILFGAPLALWWWQGRAQGSWRWIPSQSWWWGRAVAGGLGIGAIAVGLLAYNYARFGNPAEFGLNYQLTGMYESQVTHFTPRFIPFNAFVYYLAPAQWSRYFPFVEPIHPPRQPAGYYGIEFVYGVLTCMPLAWLALVAPLGLWRRSPAERGPLAAMLGSVTLLYLPLGALMLFFVTAAARYMVDFTPALMLLACCGMLAVARLARSRWQRRLMSLVSVSLAAVSVFFGVMASFQLHELLRINDAPAHRRLAHFFGGPIQWYETMRGTQHGPLELKLRFSSPRVGERQLLVSTGWEAYSDHVFVDFPSEGHAQFGFVHSGEAAWLSEPMALDFNAEHTLNIEAGSLYPPEAHPFFDGRTAMDIAAHSRWLQLRVDGKTVLQGPQIFFDGSPGHLRLAGKDVAEAYGGRFSGRILSVKRDAYHWMKNPAGEWGPLKFTVFFARNPSLRHQPLVATGETGRANLLHLHFESPGQLRFGYDHLGVGGYESPLIACDPGVMHEIEVRFGALLPPARTPLEAALRESLVVRLDGQVVWSQRMPYYENPGRKIMVASNEVGANSCDPVFAGVIRSMERPAAGDSTTGPVQGALRLQTLFPAGRSGRSEPLVVTGSAGSGDLLFVTYLDEHRVRFGFSHEGGRLWQGEPVEIDYRRLHDLEVHLASLSSAPDAGEKYQGDLKLVLDGSEIWRQPVEFYRSLPEVLAIGENRLGSAACDAVFSGGIVQVERLGQP